MKTIMKKLFIYAVGICLLPASRHAKTIEKKINIQESTKSTCLPKPRLLPSPKTFH